MSCADTERLLELRASELLSPEEDEALSAHLLACPSCRAQEEALGSLFEHARLPPPTAGDEARLLELRRLRPLARPAKTPVLRWVVTAAAVAASALIGVRFGTATGPSTHRASLGRVTAMAPSQRQVSANRVQDVAYLEDGLDAAPSSDLDTDSPLYDAVVFQGGVMPFDADNG